MGLDISFYKVKKARKSKQEPLKTFQEYHDINAERAKSRLKRFANKTIKRLTEAENAGNYDEVYKTIFPKEVSKYIRYEWKYQSMINEVVSIDKVKKFFEEQIGWCYPDEDAYFRKVNCIYRYFQMKLDDECAFVTKVDLEDIIERCDKILEGFKFNGEEIPYEKVELAKELLPTQSGFFFGSTDYDKWYFSDIKDVRKQMKKLLRGFNEDTDVIYVVMSW